MYIIILDKPQQLNHSQIYYANSRNQSQNMTEVMSAISDVTVIKGVESNGS